MFVVQKKEEAIAYCYNDNLDMPRCKTSPAQTNADSQSQTQEKSIPTSRFSPPCKKNKNENPPQNRTIKRGSPKMQLSHSIYANTHVHIHPPVVTKYYQPKTNSSPLLH